MSHLMITSLVVVTMMVLFIWNKLPAPIVAVFSSLVLYFAGVLNAHDTLAGFGDPLVVFIAALLVIGIGLEATGVGTWAGQLLIRYAGTNKTRLLVSLLLLSALFTALIGMNGAVVTMLPIAVVIAWSAFVTACLAAALSLRATCVSSTSSVAS